MSVELNHTIINSIYKRKSANFMAEILGLTAPKQNSTYFLAVKTNNEVTLDFCDSDEKIEPQHYAFKVSEPEFDQIFGRIKALGLNYWADPGKRKLGSSYTHNGGRGVYFEDPSGHLLEILTY